MTIGGYIADRIFTCWLYNKLSYINHKMWYFANLKKKSNGVNKHLIIKQLLLFI